MALECFRNAGMLEDLHAGMHPSSETGDFSDVKVVSPYGEIPCAKFSRLSDAEMRALMVEVVNRSYRFLSNFLSDPYGDAIIERLRQTDPVEKWSDPLVRAC